MDLIDVLLFSSLILFSSLLCSISQRFTCRLKQWMKTARQCASSIFVVQLEGLSSRLQTNWPSTDLDAPTHIYDINLQNLKNCHRSKSLLVKFVCPCNHVCSCLFQMQRFPSWPHILAYLPPSPNHQLVESQSKVLKAQRKLF